MRIFLYSAKVMALALACAVGGCATSIMQYLNRWVPLDGSFAPGEYVVRANSAAVTFRLVAGGEGTLRVEPDPGALPQ